MVPISSGGFRVLEDFGDDEFRRDTYRKALMRNWLLKRAGRWAGVFRNQVRERSASDGCEQKTNVRACQLHIRQRMHIEARARSSRPKVMNVLYMGATVGEVEDRIKCFPTFWDGEFRWVVTAGGDPPGADPGADPANECGIASRVR